MTREFYRGYIIGAGGFALGSLLYAGCSVLVGHAQESVFPNDNAPVVMQQDQFGNTYAQQPGQAQWRFSPNGPGSYQYQQGLDHWGSVNQSGSGTSSFDNRLDGSYRYSWTPASPIPGVKNGIVIEGGRR